MHQLRNVCEISAVRIHACLFGCWQHETSYLHDNRSPDNVVHGPIVKRFLDIEVEVLLVGADGPHQLSDVVGIQSAGLCRQTAGKVCVADMGDSLKMKKQKDFVILHQIGRKDL